MWTCTTTISFRRSRLHGEGSSCRCQCSPQQSRLLPMLLAACTGGQGTGAIRAKHAAVARLRLQDACAVRAVEEVLAGIRRHRLLGLVSAVRARDRPLQFDQLPAPSRRDHRHRHLAGEPVVRTVEGDGAEGIALEPPLCFLLQPFREARSHLERPGLGAISVLELAWQANAMQATPIRCPA
jgi:hypothetical protein